MDDCQQGLLDDWQQGLLVKCQPVKCHDFTCVARSAPIALLDDCQPGLPDHDFTYVARLALPVLPNDCQSWLLNDCESGLPDDCLPHG